MAAPYFLLFRSKGYYPRSVGVTKSIIRFEDFEQCVSIRPDSGVCGQIQKINRKSNQKRKGGEGRVQTISSACFLKLKHMASTSLVLTCDQHGKQSLEKERC